MVKHRSKVKYLGTVAAALLVVAPVVTPVIPAFGNLGTVQAAETAASDLNGDFDFAGDVSIFFRVKKNTKVYADSSLDPAHLSSKNATANDGAVLSLRGVSLKDGELNAYHIADSKGDTKDWGWVSATEDTTAFNGFFEKSKFGFWDTFGSQSDKDQTFTLAKPANLYKLADASTFTATSVVLNGAGHLTGVTSSDNGTATLDQLTATYPVTEDKTIVADKAYVKPNATEGAAIYSDIQTVTATAGKLVKEQPVVAYVKAQNGTILAYKVADGQYVKAGEVTAEPVPLTADKTVSKDKPYVKAVNGSAQIYADMATTTPIADQTLKTDVKIVAYVKDPDGNIVAYQIADGQYVKATETQDEAMPLTEDTTISTDKPYIKAKTGSAQVYADKAATAEIAGQTITKDTKIAAYVKDPDGNVVAYRIADGQYVKASDVTEEAVPLSEDTTISKAKPYVQPSSAGVQIYKDMATSQPSTDLKMHNVLAILAYVKDPDNNVVAYRIGTNQYVKADEVTAIAMPLKEVTEITADKAYVQSADAENSAPIYTDKATTDKTTATLTTGQKVQAYVLDINDKIVAYRLDTNQYVKASDVTATAIPKPVDKLTEDTKIDPAKSLVTAKASQGASIYSDKATTAATDDVLSNTNQHVIQAYVRNADGDIVAYKIGNDQYVKNDDVLVSGVPAGTNTETNATGSVTTTTAAIPYRDKGLTIVLGAPVAKGLTFTYSSVVKDANGKIVAYGFKNGALTTYLKAGDVKVNSTDSGNTGGNTGSGDNNNNGNTGSDDNDDNTGNTGEDDNDDSNDANQNLTIVRIPKGQVTVSTGNKALHVYNDGATTKDSGAKLATDYDLWTVTHVAKDANGDVVAYDLGNNQWVKASEVKLFALPNDKTQVASMPKGTAIYSNFKGAKIYSDAAATKAIGTLNTQYDEWSAYKVSKDANGNIVAYDLGSNQWVKASDLQLQKNLSGTFVAKQGTALYQADGTLAGVLGASNAYRVFAVRYINGHQALKLGNDSQWIIAATGDYYPA
ncbi:MAG: SLAP domain-containing protein [Lactobacillus sp.]|jgi:hypothetical protein|nr:SLAP domain-containing protein [Lactobacillus sp.]